MAKRKKKDKTPAVANLIVWPVMGFIGYAILTGDFKEPATVSKTEAVQQESIAAIIAGIEDETKPVELYTTNASNNPGNIRGKDGKFINFATPEDGYNALVRDITIKLSGKSRMMQWKFGKNYKPTIAKLIYVYAPPHENDYKRYVMFLSEHTGIHPDQILTGADVEVIVQQMIVMEQGHKNAAIYKQYASN
jgi:hypothetical protein